MGNIKAEYLYCPVCRTKLYKVRGTSNNELYSVCTNSSCRKFIKNDSIAEMDISIYSRIQPFFPYDNTDTNIFILLKENLKGPLMSKATNGPFDKDRCMYNIVHAESREDAVDKFQKKFEHIEITGEMVAPIHIVEDIQ